MASLKKGRLNKMDAVFFTLDQPIKYFKKEIKPVKILHHSHRMELKTNMMQSKGGEQNHPPPENTKVTRLY